MLTESNQDQENPTDNLIPTPESTKEVEPEQVIDDSIEQQLTDATEIIVNRVEVKKSKAKLIAFATGVLTLLVGTGALFASFGGGSGKNVPTKISGTSNPSEENTDSTTEKSETTVSTDGTEVTISVETINSSEYDYTKAPENIVEGYSFEKALTVDQQTELKNLELMSDVDFFKLPEAEQLKYGAWIRENYGPRFEYMMSVNSDNINFKYTEIPKTAEEFAANYAYMFAMITSYTTVTQSETSLDISFDSANAAKTSVLLYSATKEHQDGWVTSLSDFDNTTSMVKLEYKIEGYKVENGKTIVNIFFISNNTYDMPTEKAHGQYTFEPIDFVDIHGNTQTIYRCTYAVSQGNDQYIQNLG